MLLASPWNLRKVLSKLITNEQTIIVQSEELEMWTNLKVVLVSETVTNQGALVSYFILVRCWFIYGLKLKLLNRRIPRDLIFCGWIAYEMVSTYWWVTRNSDLKPHCYSVFFQRFFCRHQSVIITIFRLNKSKQTIQPSSLVIFSPEDSFYSQKFV